AQIREILISESAWEEMTCLFAPSLENDGQNIKSIIELIEKYPDFFKKDGKQVLFMGGSLSMILNSFKEYLSDVERALDEFEKQSTSGDKVAAAVGITP
ncbi:hypothetical protein OSK38_11465, partial [Escherichia coli]|nr:hypothetical protein [Escherichia coli]